MEAIAENVEVYDSGDLLDALTFIGKRLTKIENGEYSLTLTFEDGSTIESRGNTYDGCALDVDFGPTNSRSAIR